MAVFCTAQALEMVHRQARAVLRNSLAALFAPTQALEMVDRQARAVLGGPALDGFPGLGGALLQVRLALRCCLCDHWAGMQPPGKHLYKCVRVDCGTAAGVPGTVPGSVCGTWIAAAWCLG